VNSLRFSFPQPFQKSKPLSSLGLPITFKLSTQCLQVDWVYTPTKGKALNGRQQDVLRELHKAIEKDGIPPTDDIKALFPDSPQNCPVKVVNLSKWRVLAYKVIAIDGESNDIAEAKKKAFQYCVKALRKSGKVGFYDDYVWNS
jgi:hypothetical protein